jgi:hypothetical protein
LAAITIAFIANTIVFDAFTLVFVIETSVITG